MACDDEVIPLQERIETVTDDEATAYLIKRAFADRGEEVA
jgi:hypothetical protein